MSLASRWPKSLDSSIYIYCIWSHDLFVGPRRYSQNNEELTWPKWQCCKVSLSSALLAWMSGGSAAAGAAASYSTSYGCGLNSLPSDYQVQMPMRLPAFYEPFHPARPRIKNSCADFDCDNTKVGESWVGLQIMR